MWIIFYLIAFSAPFWSVFLMKAIGDNDLVIVIAVIGAFFPSVGVLVGSHEWLYKKLEDIYLTSIIINLIATTIGIVFLVISVLVMISIW